MLLLIRNDSQLQLDFVCFKIFHLRMATRLGNYLLDHVKKNDYNNYCLFHIPTQAAPNCLFVSFNLPNFNVLFF